MLILEFLHNVANPNALVHAWSPSKINVIAVWSNNVSIQHVTDWSAYHTLSLHCDVCYFLHIGYTDDTKGQDLLPVYC